MPAVSCHPPKLTCPTMMLRPATYPSSPVTGAPRAALPARCPENLDGGIPTSCCPAPFTALVTGWGRVLIHPPGAQIKPAGTLSPHAPLGRTVSRAGMRSPAGVTYSSASTRVRVPSPLCATADPLLLLAAAGSGLLWVPVTPSATPRIGSGAAARVCAGNNNQAPTPHNRSPSRANSATSVTRHTFL